MAAYDDDRDPIVFTIWKEQDDWLLEGPGAATATTRHGSRYEAKGAAMRRAMASRPALIRVIDERGRDLWTRLEATPPE